jgi:chromosome segregation ATPase
LLSARGADDSSAKADAEQAKAKLESVQSELGKLRIDHARLADDLAARTKETEAAKVAATKPAQELAGLRAQVEDMFTKLSESERRLAQTQQTVQAARSEAERTKADYLALETKHAEATKAAEAQGSTVAELTGLNEKIGAEKAALESNSGSSGRARMPRKPNWPSSRPGCSQPSNPPRAR